MPFHNRAEAGRQLALKLTHYANRNDVIVLGLPRGGVPVAAEVAAALNARLDVFLVRKLGLPGQRELAMGAIASGGVRVLNDDVIRQACPSEAAIERVALAEALELGRRERAYRGARPPLDAAGKTVILVDDGLATGASMRAAVAAVRRLGPARVVVAVPVGAVETCTALRAEADEVVCLQTPDPFYAVGQWYVDFGETTDDEVRGLLGEAASG
ncbi:MAG TPA: phosphoribosyltransferase family protein [Gemmataceae bacterium]|jgi:putative phosphoribosyl transferase|nr:phosphoribosyltransferase family protein [Gemmataceae bacterium]